MLLVQKKLYYNSNMNNNEEETMYFHIDKKTQKEHILSNSDTYIGSVEPIDTLTWIQSPTDESRIVQKPILCITGLYKIFDEVVVNCRDHVIRMQSKINQQIPNSLPVTYIDISIDATTGQISMKNDGNGMDVVVHSEHGKWVPELAFAHLMVSTNFNKEEEKTVGGKNGFGSKLVLIWSTYGRIETVDHIRGLKYTQEFWNNLDRMDEPKITPVHSKSPTAKVKPYTLFTFTPDYRRFGVDSLTPDMLSLFRKRVMDIAAVTDSSVKVKLNSRPLAVKHFESYLSCYLKPEEEEEGEEEEGAEEEGEGAEEEGAKGKEKKKKKVSSPSSYVYEQTDPRWEYAVALTPCNEFMAISFVNGICTSKGGKHVDYVLNQITKKLVQYIETKKKRTVTSHSIKEQLILFLRCDIVNPAFESQTKDFLNTPVAKFGSKCEVSDKFIEKVATKLGVMNAACVLTEIKENRLIAKKTDGSKTRRVSGIPKLEDANWAGTEKSRLCQLILCEGDSAKAGVLSGLSSEDRNTIGVYPLKGKLMNVRGKSKGKLAANTEISEIKQILGLENGKIYNSMDEVHRCLRYSSVILVTDQDLDGSHIKGLCLNLFHSEWPSLTQLPHFLGFMNTPILKAHRGTQELEFYNQGEYQAWQQQQHQQPSSWQIKYYKGLGTSTKAEFVEYFRRKKIVMFQHTGVPSDDAIDMLFHSKRAADRKHWLETVYDPASFADTSQLSVTYEEFVNKELIHFSKYDCERNIPNLVDGLKISQRKVLFAAFKRNLVQEQKVNNFAGYVSEHSGYHHGEASLISTIVGMAQDFVGSNNVQLLQPLGQFGTRLAGGKDAASPRYISTQLSALTRLLFPADDESWLTYLMDDNQSVEPLYYVPIVPMILVNGTSGVGTGFSTDIMCHHLVDIIDYLMKRLALPLPLPLQIEPYYDKFRGTIVKGSESRYVFKGKYEHVKDDTIRITELPVGCWTDDYKTYLLELAKEGGIVKDVDSFSTDVEVNLLVYLQKGKKTELESKSEMNGHCNGLEKALNLCTTQTTTNMHLWNFENKLRKYASVNEIMDEYFEVRLKGYVLRKQHLLQKFEAQCLKMENKSRYIRLVLDGSIDLRHKSNTAISGLLETCGFAKEENNYHYLITMPMNSVSLENATRLETEYQEWQHKKRGLEQQSPETMWQTDLSHLSDAIAAAAADVAIAAAADVAASASKRQKPKRVSSSSSSSSSSSVQKKARP